MSSLDQGRNSCWMFRGGCRGYACRLLLEFTRGVLGGTVFEDIAQYGRGLCCRNVADVVGRTYWYSGSGELRSCNRLNYARSSMVWSRDHLNSCSERNELRDYPDMSILQSS